MRVPMRANPQAAGDGTGTATGSSSSAAASTFGIRADLLIPGRGDPIEDGAVVVSDSTIVWVGSHAGLPSEHASVPFSHHVPVLMPGMWDVHSHFVGAFEYADVRDAMKHFLPGAQITLGAILVDDLRATLMAGFTSIRETGGYGGDLAPVVDLGRVPGPSIYSAYTILTITGGHADRPQILLDVLKNEAVHGGSMYGLCDGPDECTRMVRQQIRRGARFIKICSTGGIQSAHDQPEASQFSPAELRAIVDEAARSGRVVASHAIGKPGIMAALDAGVKTIEHGMYLDEEVAAKMKQQDAILVPTRHIVEELNRMSDTLPPPVRAKFDRMVQLSRDSTKLAVKLGVKMALGTDTMSSDRNHPISHGRNARELHWAVEAGMTPLQAIEMATATPPETLGPQAPRSGQLKAGYDADLLAVCEDPLADIDVLTEPANITHVWKGGKLFKSP